MKQNFFDHLDGGWSDLIADTYREANECKIQFTFLNDYTFLWKPTVVNKDGKMILMFNSNVNKYTSEDANILNVKTIKFKNKDYNIKIYEKENDARKMINFYFSPCMNDVIIDNRLYSDIIKKYLGEENIKLLESQGSFVSGFDGFEEYTNYKTLEDFLNYKQPLDIILRNRKPVNLIFFCLGDYDNNPLVPDNQEKIVNYLYSVAIKK